MSASLKEAPTYARVIVDVPARELSAPFDYEVPERFSGKALVGCTVVAPFGHRHVAGYVTELVAETQTDAEKIRPLADVVTEPLFAPWAPDVARWMAQEYAAPLSECVRLFLPPGGPPRVVEGAAGEGWALSAPSITHAHETVIHAIAESGYEPRANAVLQRALLDALSAGPVRSEELRAQLGNVAPAIKRLEEAGAVSVETRVRGRRPSQGLGIEDRSVELTPEQRNAYQIAGDSVGAGSAVLVDGVTGSGKTEVYLRTIADLLAKDRGAIVLVPEISLTPQAVGRFRARFGDAIGVLHSRLSAGERHDEWWRLRTGEARIAVGPRSALFAPVDDLALIVVDEEHDGSYKQGSTPRYHARDVARRIASETGASVLLGSATPSLETLHSCAEGRTARAVLDERVGGAQLPQVKIVDMGVEFQEGHRSMFSRPLLEHLERIQEAGEKGVLLLNRRGFASFVLCRECGFVPECPKCAVSMTAHRQGRDLQCHHCGHRSTTPATCPECDGAYLRQFGAGTERVQVELERVAPDLPAVRMDADTTRKKGGHELRLAEFEALSHGVLIGTQMVAKGLDYPDVTLVGVLDADTVLHLPDFRAGERTYQLLSQVAGRAGRGDRDGHVVIQTYWPDHPAITAAASHDRTTFLGPEIQARRELGYPPFSRLLRFVASAPTRSGSDAIMADVAAFVEAEAPETWRRLGPAPAVLSRLKEMHRTQLLVFAPEDAALGELAGRALSHVSRPSDGMLVADVDPLDLL